MSKKLVTSGSVTNTDLMLNQPAKEHLIQFIIDNWDTSFSPDLPAVDSVKWRMWWTGTFGLHVHATEVLSLVQNRALGSMPGLIAYRAVIVLDLFSRSLNQVYPPDLAAASAFIQQLIEVNVEGLKSKGIAAAHIFRAMEQKEQDPTSSVFHYAIEVELDYAKTAVTV